MRPTESRHFLDRDFFPLPIVDVFPAQKDKTLTSSLS